MARKDKNPEDYKAIEYFDFWFEYLYLLSINRFDWHNLPEEIDELFQEKGLIDRGCMLFAKDEILGKYLITKFTTAGVFDLYGIPTRRMASANNGYHKMFTDTESVIIGNNRLFSPEISKIIKYALQLANLDLAKDVNTNAQKTPIGIQCEDKERASYEKWLAKYNGNAPVILTSKNFNQGNINTISFNVPFVVDKLHAELHMLLNDAYTALGIESSNTDKAERMITDEVTSNLGAVETQRYVGLNARRYACKQINKMFGLNVTVDFKSNMDTITTPEEIDYNKQLLIEEQGA
jgi:hypothetical protein